MYHLKACVTNTKTRVTEDITQRLSEPPSHKGILPLQSRMCDQKTTTIQEFMHAYTRRGKRESQEEARESVQRTT